MISPESENEIVDNQASSELKIEKVDGAHSSLESASGTNISDCLYLHSRKHALTQTATTKTISFIFPYAVHFPYVVCWNSIYIRILQNVYH